MTSQQRSTTDRPGGTGLLAGRPVGRVGYGAMQLERATLTEADATALLHRVLELGVNHLDTAEFYGDGLANQRIRAALHPYPEELVLVSKVGAAHDPAGLRPAQRPHELRAEVEANLRTLGTERLDVVNLRRIDEPPGLVAEGGQIVDLDAQLAELDALRTEGKIGAIGLSNVSIEQLRRALPAGIVCVQNHYSLLERGDEDMLALCAAHDIAWVPFFPLGSGFSRIASVTDNAAVQRAAHELGVTPAQVGLAWLLAHAPGTLLIPGTTSMAHLAENVAAGAVALPADTLAELDAVS